MEKIGKNVWERVVKTVIFIGSFLIFVAINLYIAFKLDFWDIIKYIRGEWLIALLAFFEALIVYSLLVVKFFSNDRIES